MQSPADFVHKLLAALREHAVDVEGAQLDHVCYRVGTQERYEELCMELGTKATLLGEHLIGGRPIATWLMHLPWTVEGRSIDVLELPAPKAGSPYPEGYEHAEFVIGEEPLHFAHRYPQLEWDLSGAGKPVNPDVRLRIGRFSVKFHRKALEDVIPM
jgi:predicted metalloenzyme YecM